MVRWSKYESSDEGNEITTVIDDWYAGLDAETKAQVDKLIARVTLKVNKLGELGGRELVGKIILHLMREGAL